MKRLPFILLPTERGSGRAAICLSRLGLLEDRKEMQIGLSVAFRRGESQMDGSSACKYEE